LDRHHPVLDAYRGGRVSADQKLASAATMVDQQISSTAAKQRFGPKQKIVLAWVLAGLGLGFVFKPVLTAQLLLSINLVFTAGFLGLRGFSVLAVLGTRQVGRPLTKKSELPFITILCPVYKEAESIPYLLHAVDRLDYPKNRRETLILIEEDDEETLRAALKHPSRPIPVLIPSGAVKTKPNALNVGLSKAKGDIIGVYDAEDRPERSQLRKVAAAFSAGGAELGCVQAQLNYHNRDDGYLQRMFALEYALQFDWFLPGLTKLGLPLPLGGTSNFVRRDALERAGGWDPYNVTEDADLGLRLGALGYRIEAIRSTTFEEATETPSTWVKQRSRWLKGFLQTWFVHLRKASSLKDSLVLHFAIGAVVISAIANPITWGLWLSWLFFDLAPLKPIFEGWLGEICLLFFVAANLTHLWFMLLAPLRRGWMDLTGAALFLPIYWTLQSVAGYKALGGFLFRPHYWEKTEHSAGADPVREASLA
jgi:cellulose synthase/poly-beta-1,6-N-acetylglucosamine synthase-like glycosyltransferase